MRKLIEIHSVFTGDTIEEVKLAGTFMRKAMKYNEGGIPPLVALIQVAKEMDVPDNMSEKVDS